MKPLDLIGQRFTRLVVIARAENSARGSTKWVCQCDCKNIITAFAGNLKRGFTQSCGCLHREIASVKGPDNWNFKHGQSSYGKPASPAYKSWESAIRRCHNPKDKDYPRYGAKGIIVCERWRNSFETFFKDLGERPTNMTLDRYPNKTGNYEPGNCRWADPQTQADNRRKYQALDNFTDAEIYAEFIKRKLG
jgi:hypothetical protein